MLFEGEASIAKSSTAKTTLRQIGDDDLRVCPFVSSSMLATHEEACLGTDTITPGYFVTWLSHVHRRQHRGMASSYGRPTLYMYSSRSSLHGKQF